MDAASPAAHASESGSQPNKDDINPRPSEAIDGFTLDANIPESSSRLETQLDGLASGQQLSQLNIVQLNLEEHSPFWQRGNREVMLTAPATHPMSSPRQDATTRAQTTHADIKTLSEFDPLDDFFGTPDSFSPH